MVISEQDILDKTQTEFDVQVSQGQGANRPVSIWSTGSLWVLFPPLPIHFAVIVTVCD